MHEYLNNYQDEIVQRMVEYERVMIHIKKGELFNIIERDLEVIKDKYKYMTMEEKFEFISLLLSYGTAKLHRCGYDENEIQEINQHLRKNFSYILDSNVSISVKEIFDDSIMSWRNSVEKIKEITAEKKDEKSKIKDLKETCRHLVIGGALAIFDTYQLVEVNSTAATISIITSIAAFMDAATSYKQWYQ